MSLELSQCQKHICQRSLSAMIGGLAHEAWLQEQTRHKVSTRYTVRSTSVYGILSSAVHGRTVWALSPHDVLQCNKVLQGTDLPDSARPSVPCKSGVDLADPQMRLVSAQYQTNKEAREAMIRVPCLVAQVQVGTRDNRYLQASSEHCS